MTEYLGREFHRQEVGRVVDAEKNYRYEKKEEYGPGGNEPDIENGKTNHRRETKKEHQEDKEPEAAGEQSADCDLIPIDDAALPSTKKSARQQVG